MVTIPSTNELPEDIFEDDEPRDELEKKPERTTPTPTPTTPAPITPTPEQLETTLDNQSNKDIKEEDDDIGEIPKETISEIRKELLKEEAPVKQKSAAVPVEQIVDAPTVSDIQGRQQRIEKTKKGSSFLKIIFTIFIFSIVIVIAAVSYYFFISRVPQETTVANSEPEATTEVKELAPLIDTSSWPEYTNTKAGISFRYPEEFTLERYDAELGPPNTSSTPQLIMQSDNAKQKILVWIDSVGISNFVNPSAEIEGNPLNSGVHLILERVGDNVVVGPTRYFKSRSGVVQPDLSSILAYIPEQPGVWQYTFVYIDRAGEASEDFIRAFIETIDLQFDTDSDGIFDDKEAEYGTDPNEVDTDGDGYSDWEEIRNGYNPLGEGFLKE